MSHLDSNTLATYNSLADPHLQCYFSNERIRSHLKHAGLISRRGEIIPDSEYRLKLTRHEHKKHVRQMLAENIVHRAIDMERARQAELKRQFDMVSKVALVHSIKESRRRGAYPSGNIQNSNDMGLLSMNSSWSQSRPKSATHHRETETMNEEFDEVRRISRVQSANVNGADIRAKYSSKSLDRRRRQTFNRPKSTSAQRSLPVQRSRLMAKSTDASSSNASCRIKMIYCGPHTKLDYDHSIFQPVDEIIVMQQHCGGENLIVYKDQLKPGDEFSFNSRRHSDYPFGLSLYVKGLIDSRISTCCEYKHRHGVKLGGERGHFAILSVEGSKPCIKCRFEKQSRLKQYGDSPKYRDDTDDGKKNPITISIPVSDETKTRQIPVKIPVRQVSNTNENYAEDFDGSDDTETLKHEHSSESNGNKIKIDRTTENTHLTAVPLKTPTETSSASTTKLQEKGSTKTWQIIFHTSNLSNSSFKLPHNSSLNTFLKFSFISIDGKDETETYEIKMRDFPQRFKSGEQASFQTKLRNIGIPQQIRLIIETTGTNDDDDDDDDDDSDIKWQLDHIELIDPKTFSHYNFPCHQWIRSSEEKILKRDESTEDDIPRKTSKSTSSSKNSLLSPVHKKSSPKLSKNEPKPKTSSRSSSSSLPSSYESPKQSEPMQKSTTVPNRQISTESEINTEQNKVHYRISIFPSNDEDGEFNALNNSQIFVRLNNETKSSMILDKNLKGCPSFEPGKNKSFEVDLIQSTNEQPTKLTIGYYNSYITAGKWKLDKIVLTNTKTGQETIFPCKETLRRNDFDLRAENTFQAQLIKSNYEHEEKEHSTPHNVNVTKRLSVRSTSQESIQLKKNQLTTNKRNQSSSSESLRKVTKTKDDKKPLSTNSSQSRSDHENGRDEAEEDDDDDEDEEDNEYNRMFRKENSNNPAESDSSPSRPKTRRGVQNSIAKNNEPDDKITKSQTTADIWRPSSELDRKEPVDPLVGLDDLQGQTSRSNDEKHQNSFPSTANNQSETQFKNWYPTTTDEDN